MKPVYLLQGENKENILEYKNFLIKNFLENKDDFNCININMQENTIENLIYECQSLNIFSEKKIIIAENCLFFEKKTKKNKVTYNTELLLDYIKNTNPSIMLIIICKESDDKNKIVKEIKKVGEIKTFNNLNSKEITNYIIDYLQKSNKKISRETAIFLQEYTAFDFLNIKKELEKLELLDEDEIKKDDVTKITIKSLEYDIFSLINNLFSMNYKEFKIIYENFKTNKEEPILLLSLILSQLRIYYKVKLLLNENFSQKDIANMLAVHPYRIQLATSKVIKCDEKILLKCILLCEEYDKQLKSSYIDKYTLLDIFINKLIQLINKS